MIIDENSGGIRFLDIAGFPGYRVSSDGMVWSCWKKACWKHTPSVMTDQWHELTVRPVRGGYLQAALYRERRQVRRYIHRLVLEHFVGPKPSGMQACHFPDRNRTNNRVENLRWDTAKNNCADRESHGGTCRGSKSGKSVWMEADVLEARRMLREGSVARVVAERFGVSIGCIRNVKLGHTWGWLK